MAKKQADTASGDAPSAWTVGVTFAATINWGTRQYEHRFRAGHTYRIVDDNALMAPVDGLHKTIQRSCYDLVVATAP